MPFPIFYTIFYTIFSIVYSTIKQPANTQGRPSDESYSCIKLTASIVVTQNGAPSTSNMYKHSVLRGYIALSLLAAAAAGDAAELCEWIDLK